MKKFIYTAVLLTLRSDMFKVLLPILIIVGSNMTYAQPCVTEVCNEVDDDCDGVVDEDVQTTYYIDSDVDGYYNGYITILACTEPFGGWWWAIDPAGYYDCNDADSSIGLGGSCGEVCNGIDDDGNGLIDGDDPGLVSAIYWYADSDGDGYGDPSTSLYACEPPSGYLPWPNHVDCDDTNSAVWENCNSVDTDCDGVPDDFDICPGGDDSVDNNEDGIADCTQLLNYTDYSPDWHCDNNKIYVCHNDNNPHTICIDANSLLPAHYGHGDMIGPCTTCSEQNLSKPESNMITFDVDASGLTIFPNPTSDELNVYLYDIESAAVLTISNQLGQVIWRKRMEEGQFETKISLEQGRFGNGIYLVRVVSNGGISTKWLIIER